MKWTIVALLVTTAVTLGGESLEQRLRKRVLKFPSRSDGQTVSEVLNSLSRDYRARYQESLPIFIAVDLLQPRKPEDIKPSPPIPEIPGLVPVNAPANDPGTARTAVTLEEAPVTELLRYVSSLCGVAFTIGDDVVLIHAAAK